MQRGLRACEKIPRVAVGVVRFGVGRQHCRRTPRWIHREGHQADIRHPAYGLLHLVHLRRHAGAGSRAVGEDEIRNPDLPLEDMAVEPAAVLIRQLKVGHNAIGLQFRDIVLAAIRKTGG